MLFILSVNNLKKAGDECFFLEGWRRGEIGLVVKAPYWRLCNYQTCPVNPLAKLICCYEQQLNLHIYVKFKLDI